MATGILVLIASAPAHEMAWCPTDTIKGVLHQDISFNNILIYETYRPEELRDAQSNELVRFGMLSGWNMSKFKAQITASIGPRQSNVMVCSAIHTHRR